MKKTYQNMELEILLVTDDVIRTSPTDNVETWPDKDEGLWGD